jgi:hypothetical protein
MHARPIATRRWLALLLASPWLLLAGPAFAAAATVYGESTMVKVRPLDPPRTDEGVGLSGARNEFVSFQIVIHGGDAGLTHLKASLPSLGPITGGDIRLYRETYLTTTHPSTPSAALGAWPDGLQPDVDEIANESRWAFPMDVPAHESRVVWVDVLIPVNATPGTVTGSVQLTADGAFSKSVAVTLTIIDAALPSTSSLPTAFMLDSNGVCQAHTGSNDCGGDDQEFAMLGKYERLALEHRITLANIVPRVPADHSFTNLDRWVGAYLDGSAPSRLQGAKMTTAQYQAPVEVASYAAFAQHFRQKGWLDRAFDYTADEPPYGSTFDQAAARAATVKQGDPGLRTLVTTTIDQADAHQLSGAIDLMVPVINDVDGTASPYQGDQRAHYDSFAGQPGKGLWMYQSCMSHGCAYGTNGQGGSNARWPSYMVDASAAENRAMQWLIFAERGSGELYYQTAQAITTAWTDQFQFNGNGDGTLFYPGTTNVIGGQTDVPVASIRLKLIRQGLQDYEWLKLVSDAGDPAFAMQVARALVPAASQVTGDGSAFDRARLQLIARYLELTHKQAPPPAPGGPPTTSTSNPSQTVNAGPAPDPAPAAAAPGTSKAVLASSTSKGLPKSGCASGGGELSILAGLVGAVGLRRRRRR